MIFSLPFHVARYFRPTFLEVFDLSNAALGDVFAIYGIVAMLSYYPGGTIADRFSARKLMTASLIATAFGGFYMAQIPSHSGLTFLFAYWGLTSILLCWAALIRTTRDWGGHWEQGMAFGLLDGGRGLIAALVATLSVFFFSRTLPDDLEVVTDLQRKLALRAVIYHYTFTTIIAGLLVWFFIPDSNNNSPNNDSITNKRAVFFQPVIWLQAVIVICAYCGYKGLDNYALYAVEVLKMNEVESARFTSIAAYLRPVAAVSAGFLVDRTRASKIISIAFIFLLFGYSLLAFSSTPLLITNIIYSNLIITFVAVFAIRGVYFALLEETNISKNITGTAVGLISVIGFTPDVFFAAITGRILDNAPGIIGHQHFFMLLAYISLIGMIATFLLAYNNKKILKGVK